MWCENLCSRGFFICLCVVYVSLLCEFFFLILFLCLHRVFSCFCFLFFVFFVSYGLFAILLSFLLMIHRPPLLTRFPFSLLLLCCFVFSGNLCIFVVLCVVFSFFFLLPSVLFLILLCFSLSCFLPNRVCVAFSSFLSLQPWSFSLDPLSHSPIFSLFLFMFLC